MSRLRSLLAAIVRAVPVILGAPDYERYVAFERARNPGAVVADRATFERERLASRYARPGARCC
ncbi:MAG TPA: YbdD/YjiX family protein [Gemmatirosa sp.]